MQLDGAGQGSGPGGDGGRLLVLAATNLPQVSLTEAFFSFFGCLYRRGVGFPLVGVLWLWLWLWRWCGQVGGGGVCGFLRTGRLTGALLLSNPHCAWLMLWVIQQRHMTYERCLIFSALYLDITPPRSFGLFVSRQRDVM